MNPVWQGQDRGEQGLRPPKMGRGQPGLSADLCHTVIPQRFYCYNKAQPRLP